MISLVYVSSAFRPMNPEELEQILGTSRRNNTRDGITGMLLYADGNFMQAIEGPEPAIEALQQRLDGDPRHRNVQVVTSYDVDERQFPDWSMGFRQLRRPLPADLAEAFSPLKRPLLQDGADGSVAHILLERFRSTNEG